MLTMYSFIGCASYVNTTLYNSMLEKGSLNDKCPLQAIIHLQLTNINRSLEFFSLQCIDIGGTTFADVYRRKGRNQSIHNFPGCCKIFLILFISRPLS
jgi:hypothetical protein